MNRIIYVTVVAVIGLVFGFMWGHNTRGKPEYRLSLNEIGEENNVTFRFNDGHIYRATIEEMSGNPHDNARFVLSTKWEIVKWGDCK